MNKIITFITVVSLSFHLTGCNIAGPRAIKNGRMAYNVAIQDTTSEQLLLNIVRLRYRDIPFFMEIASISTSFTFDTSAGAGATIFRNDHESISNFMGLESEVAFTESPTITYTPLQGDKFVQQLMSPIELKTILLLSYSGWSIERILRVLVQDLNGLKNAPSASGPTPGHMPEFEEFVHVVKLLRKLQIKRLIHIVTAIKEKNDNNAYVIIRIDKEALLTEEGTELYSLLGFSHDQTDFTISTGFHKPDDHNYINLTTRSILSTLFFISNGVNVPENHIKSGRVTITYDELDNPFDWNQVISGLMEIKTSKLPPRNAYVSVFYRGNWFYIDDRDLNSKATFALLSQVLSLQSGEIKSTAPVLTLPVR